MAECYIGEIRMFAGAVQSQPPEGWLFCDGSLLSVSSYQALYTLLGTAYGGDGVSTFGIPDYRSRLPISKGTEAPPLTNSYALGAKGGLEVVPLTGANMPAHTHAWYASTKPATSTTVMGNMFGTVAYNAGPPASGGLYQSTTASGFTWYNAAASVIAATGISGAIHENRMPSMAIIFIIATNGVYPVQG